MSVDEVRTLLVQWDRMHTGAIQWIQRAKSHCRKVGYIETLSRRRRYIPAAQSSDSEERARGDRQAVNSILQGSAADIIKRAMVRLDAELAAASSSLEHAAERNDEHGALVTDPRARERERAPTAAAERACVGVPSRRVGRLMLQIHDELLFEVDEAGAEELRRRIRKAMVEAWPERLRVPLRVTIKQGPSWGELEVVDDEETPSTG